MLDFSHVVSTPGADIQTFYGHVSTTLRQWHTWRKPRGVKFIYMIGVGGGGGGSTGVNNAVTSGGGAGGGSGAQSAVMIPAFLVPDVLYIQCGSGGAGATTSGAAGGVGLITYVSIEPDTTLSANSTLLFANPGAGGGIATSTTGGTASGAGTVATIANMPLAGRGFYSFFVGSAGTSGGASTPAAGNIQAVPTTGLMVTGGTGGGGSGTTGAAGGLFNTITGTLGQDFFPGTAGGIAAAGATPAGVGVSGFTTRNFIMNYGGTGGGGATTTAGGIAGRGGDGAPGCGGGGGGGMNTTNTTIAKGGDGGPGFVLIASW